MGPISAHNPDSDDIRPETLDELCELMYHPRHCSDPEVALRFVRETLGQPGLTHADVPHVGQAAALRLIAALRGVFPDKTGTAAAKTADIIADRLL